MCLRAGTEFKLLDQILDPRLAVSRQDIKTKLEKSSHKQAADSRNLYLIKEGLIVAGSTAAEGVSAADMSKRLRLEQNKTQMLKNLNRFLSRERLTIHNIPASYDSAKFRKMVESSTKLKVRRLICLSFKTILKFVKYFSQKNVELCAKIVHQWELH